MLCKEPGHHQCTGNTGYQLGWHLQSRWVSKQVVWRSPQTPAELHFLVGADKQKSSTHLYMHPHAWRSCIILNYHVISYAFSRSKNTGVRKCRRQNATPIWFKAEQALYQTQSYAGVCSNCQPLPGNCITMHVSMAPCLCNRTITSSNIWIFASLGLLGPASFERYGSFSPHPAQTRC